ncbi:ABC transporter substrate-binding protein [Paenibacillus thalictri]|uniref:Extracellular solute-binding protein n=1 Tax=Paenibacillus thalictri TaxID=2527873 RepID=A0A4Q9DJN4_9BACL|nr:extracellular solute-binding protein [Paenibacillus thalictri]TBL70821.1 extracellular solute-binding protein [Paenibacillus thalictri]
MIGKKTLTILLSTFLVTSVMSACTNANTDAGKEAAKDAGSAKPDAQGGAKVKLTFAAIGSKLDDDNKTYQKLVQDYNANPKAKAQVELKLTDVFEDVNAHRTWVTTQLIGKTGPDIIPSRYLWTQEDYGKKLILDLNSFLAKPNPYFENQKWQDTFSENIMKSMLVPGTDKIAGIPTYSQAVRLFYNKDIFKKAGISEIPQTWEQFQDVQSKLKAKGITPMAIGTNKQGGDRPNWMMRYFSDQTTEKMVPQLDLDKNGLITSNEIVYGIDAGLIDFTKQPFIDLFPLLKDWTQYWPKGFNGLTVDDASDMFLRGDAAMTLGTAGFSKQAQGLVDYGVMRVPYLTKKTNPNAEEKFYEVAAGNPDGVYALPVSLQPEKQEAAVDFLMYMSSPAVQQTLAEKQYVAPVLKNAKFPDNITPFLIVNEPFKMNLFGPAFSKNLYEVFGKEGQLYLDGSQSLNDFANKLNGAARKEADSLKASQGWSKDNNYGTKK